MKTHHLLFTLAIACAFSLQSCLKDSCERTVSYIKYEPIYKTTEQVQAIVVEQEVPRELSNPGQLYYYNDYIFINERQKGIHVIHNSNPSNPVPVAFLAIEGNEDLAIRNGVLYANAYTDLLAINVETYELMGRESGVFPPIWDNQENGEMLVGYSETPVTEVVDCETFSTFDQRGGAFVDFSSVAEFDDMVTSPSGNSQGGGTGIGGSMARFTIVGNFLYTIDESSMDLFDLSQPFEPAHAGNVHIGWGIETIFPYGENLFIGSNSGMFIYDNSVPTQPTLIGEFAHATACDPVFIKGDYAYVTLRSGNACQGFTDQLDLVNITNLTNPYLVKTFPMDNPHGLSIKGEKLFLCEGDFGLKSFDITDPLTLNQHLQDHVKNIHAFDAISLPGMEDVVMVIGEDGFYQYSFDTNGNLDLLSKISIKN